MRQFILFCLSLVFSNAYFGLEEVEITVQNKQTITFPGVITVVPHTQNIVLWYCDKQNKNLLQLFSNQTTHFLMVNESKGIIIQFSQYREKLSIDKNKQGMHQLTLLAKDASHKLIISYTTQIDREFTNEVIDIIDHSLKNGMEIDQNVQEQMFGMEDYLDSFCKRNINYPPITDQYGDL